jgi:flavin reductase (DIM6/NTAB) family NADH-FMN oxidoreductase RutF
MLSINPKDLTIQVLQKYLQNAIAPRPICFASTISASGEVNVAPFSFFNLFSSNPPILVFSPAYSGRTGAPKDTLLNVREVPEVVINVVTYDMVHQVSLTSSPFPKGVNEFTKSGLTPLASELVKPFRVKESPVQLECKVIEIKELGTNGGAGNLVICEVVRIHIHSSVLNGDNQIDTQKMDLVSRMGDNWYCRAHGDSLFEVKKPVTTICVGMDAIPPAIRNSHLLTGNNLGFLASVDALPSAESVKAYQESLPVFASEDERHLFIKTLLETGKAEEAWKVIL